MINTHKTLQVIEARVPYKMFVRVWESLEGGNTPPTPDEPPVLVTVNLTPMGFGAADASAAVARLDPDKAIQLAHALILHANRAVALAEKIRGGQSAKRP